MTMKPLPWDQRIARVLVKPLTKTPVTPNQLTIFTLVLAWSGAGLTVTGDSTAINWGVGLFVLARFLDHFDGELARQKGLSSKLGYYLDYTVGALSYGALFLCIGIGLWRSAPIYWPLVLGLAGLLSAILTMLVNLKIDKLHGSKPFNKVGYPGFAGFELEDGIYLIAPMTWLGYLLPFFVAAGIGSIVYLFWSLWRLRRLRRAQLFQQHHTEN